MNINKADQEPKYGLTEKGRQMLKDAADPSKDHTYSWYVIENILDAAKRTDHFDLSLEEAAELYAGLDCEDKRLGVTKDGIATVDFIIRHDGREWLSEDWRKLNSFAEDPVAAEAAALLRQTLDENTSQDMTMGGMDL